MALWSNALFGGELRSSILAPPTETTLEDIMTDQAYCSSSAAVPYVLTINNLGICDLSEQWVCSDAETQGQRQKLRPCINCSTIMKDKGYLDSIGSFAQHTL